MQEQRHDLGAACAWLARALVRAEEPVMRAHGVEMWDYAVLGALEDGPALAAEVAAMRARRSARKETSPVTARLDARDPAS